MSDPHTLYARATTFAQDVLRQIDPATYDQPSACEGWDVRETLNHLIGGQHYFAMAAAGRGLDVADGTTPDFTAGDTAASLGQAAAQVSAAFTDEVMGSTVATVRGEVPGAVLLSIATIENVLHAWDAARGAGLDPQVPDDIGEDVLRLVEGLAPSARGQGFDDAVEVPPDAPLTARIVAMAGRQP